MLRDEFNRLMQLFADAASGKITNLEELFRQVFAFFESLNEHLKTGNEDEKKEALAMMTQMYQQMIKHTKEICERTGMTEEQLAAYSENPSNFSSAQWSAIQEARGKMLSAGQNLSNLMKPANSEPSPQRKPKEGKEDRPPPKRTRRSKWMRS